MSVELQERTTTHSPPLPAAFTPNNRKNMLDLWSLRHLIGVMVRRDLLGQYKGSVMGFFWTIINPLGHLLLYTFVFSVILRVRFGHDASTGNFALYLMAGLLPWGALAESLNRATSSIIEQPNLVKRVVFPLEILPLSVVVSSIISESVGITMLALVAAVLGYPPHASLIFLPLIMLSQFLFLGGLSWLLGSLGVYLRDLRHVMSLALSVWMYGTPIVYPAAAFPAKLQFMLWLNPMAGIVTDYRRVLLEGLMPNWPMFATYTSLGVVIWFVGYYFFSKTKRSFADVM
jgi:lipopolysaccharide transport system permease protein